MLRKSRSTDNNIAESTQIQAEEVLKRFVEGNTPTAVFWDQYLQNETIQNIIEKDPLLPKTHLKLYRNVYLYNINVDKLSHRAEVFRVISNHFLRHGLSVSPRNADHDLLRFIIGIQPPYVDIEDEKFIKSILESVPQGLKENEIRKWCKGIIEERFTYETKPPRWLQSPEWPIRNLVPLRFLYQDVYPEKYMKNTDIPVIHYYFCEPISGEIFIVEQFS